MKNIYYLNNIIDLNLWRTIKLAARDNRFDKIQSILVNTNIEKPPDFLGGLMGGFSIYFDKHNTAPHWGRYSNHEAYNQLSRN